MEVVFVGSSSEGKRIAEVVRSAIESHPRFEALAWWEKGTFKHSRSFLASLFRLLDSSGYAMLIATPDDKTFMRGEPSWRPRDNVIFEYGLFAGRNSRERVALICVGEPDIMSDMEGIKVFEVPATKRIRLTAAFKKKLVQATEDCLHQFLHPDTQQELFFAELCDLSMPLQADERAALLSQAALLRRDAISRPTQMTGASIQRLIRKHMEARPRKVGTTKLKSMPTYIRLDTMNDSKLDKLATNVACYINEDVRNRGITPSRAAFYSGGDNPLASRVASHLCLPIVTVDHTAAEGSCFTGAYFEHEHMIFLHDFVVQGETPLRCIEKLRKRRVSVDCFYTFVEREGVESIENVMRINKIDYKPFCYLRKDGGKDVALELNQKT